MKIFIALTLFLIFSIAHAQVTELLTPRLMSTGGAGVGSLLAEESAFINPSSIAFFSNSSLYYQRSNLNLEEQTASSAENKSTASNALVVSDNEGQIKGSLSYQNHRNFFGERTRFSSSLASTTSNTQSFGILYRYTKDAMNSTLPTLENNNRNYHQVVYGTTKVVSEYLSFGATLSDPFTSKLEHSLATIGAQLSYKEMVYLMFDLEANYRLSAQRTLANKAGLQLRILDDLFLRFGRFENKYTNIKGSGWGVAWNGPNLGLTFGMSQSELLDEKQEGLLEKDQKYHEASLAITIKV